jgi:hypothetical protein
MKPYVVAAFFLLLTSIATAVEDKHAAARALLDEAIEGHRRMYEQVSGVEAILSITKADYFRSSNSETSIAGVSESYPRHVFDGMFESDSVETWDVEMSWDRPSSNSVVWTTKTTDVKRGEEAYVDSRPRSFTRFDGFASIEEPTETALRAASAGSDYVVYADRQLVRDLTAMSKIHDSSFREYLEEKRDVDLGPDDTRRFISSIDDRGSSVTLTLTWMHSDDVAWSRETLTFARFPFGMGLTNAETRACGSVFAFETATDYGTFGTADSPVILPTSTRRAFGMFYSEGNLTAQATTIRIEKLRLRDEGIPLEELKRVAENRELMSLSSPPQSHSQRP